MMADDEAEAADTRCVYCNEHEAVVYCRADSARLCLFCDQVVHSANLLSRKHVRSQICDHCGREPVTMRCLTDKLVLCSECDWDVHGSCSVSASHERLAVEGYSGCPSAKEMAAILGFMLVESGAEEENVRNKKQGEVQVREAMAALQVVPWDVMVPSSSAERMCNVENGEGEISGENSWCGKLKQVLYMQLVHMHVEERNIDISRDGDEPENFGIGGAKVVPSDAYIEEQQRAFQRTVSYSKDASGRSCSLVENARGDLQLENVSTSAGQCTQIWDFHLGQLRNHYGSSRIGVSQDISEGTCKIKKLGSVKETCIAYSNHQGDLLSFRCATPSDDATIFNTCLNHNATLGTTTSDSNNSFCKSNSCSGCTDINHDGQYFLVGDCMKVETGKIDMELLAETRGNAMKRYQEKKKNRRFDKHVRYESRKARADSRKRVKGRFVKSSEA